VVELAIGEMIMLIRNLPDKMGIMHEGKWDKSAKNSNEIRGKKLGIVGYGNIGKQLSVLAEAMGLQVYYYDIDERLAIGNAIKYNSLNEMLGEVDIVSLHVDGRESNTNIIGKAQFDAMKDGIIFESGRYTSDVKEDVLTTMATYHKEPVTERMKKAQRWGDRRDGVPMSNESMERWAEVAQREQTGGMFDD